MSQDRRIKERRSLNGGPYYKHNIWSERRKTIIMAGRRDKERRVSQDRREKGK